MAMLYEPSVFKTLKVYCSKMTIGKGYVRIWNIKESQQKYNLVIVSKPLLVGGWWVAYTSFTRSKPSPSATKVKTLSD